ncbi:MAG: AAA family ATPase [Bryobacteraceae bacterium]|nr:AAA family ATPase [Bryobacteraceae bacterium]
MLTELSIENFKPFGTLQSCEFAPITLIYGPNSGGKSSIIQSLLLIRQSLQASQTSTFRLIPRGEYADLGSFKSLLHKHDLTRTLRIRVGYDVVRRQGRQFVGPRLPSQFSRRLTLEFVAANSPGSRRRDSSELAGTLYEIDCGAALSTRLKRARDEAAKLRRASLFLDETDLALYDWADTESAASLVRFQGVLEQSRPRPSGARLRPNQASPENEDAPVGATDQTQELEHVAQLLTKFFVGGRGSLPGRFIAKAGEQTPELREVEHRYGRWLYNSFFDTFNREFRELMDSVQYLGPLRSYPERHYLLLGGEKSSVGTRGENTPQVIYRGPRDITRRINTWFATFDIPYKIDIKPLGDEVTGEIVAMHLRDGRSRVEVAPSDVGFGIGQLLPIIVQGLVSRSQVLCVEQPEIHLHPRLQANLADLFIDTAGLGSEVAGRTRPHPSSQWVIETHSEALMLRLQRRIREGVIGPSSVSVLYVQPTGDGSAEIQRLRLNEAGEFIDPWPDGFFEDSYREIFALG